MKIQDLLLWLRLFKGSFCKNTYYIETKTFDRFQYDTSFYRKNFLTDYKQNKTKQLFNRGSVRIL